MCDQPIGKRHAAVGRLGRFVFLSSSFPFIQFVQQNSNKKKSETSWKPHS
jgi:hypothetical protein